MPPIPRWRVARRRSRVHRPSRPGAAVSCGATGESPNRCVRSPTSAVPGSAWLAPGSPGLVDTRVPTPLDRGSHHAHKSIYHSQLHRHTLVLMSSRPGRLRHGCRLSLRPGFRGRPRNGSCGSETPNLSSQPPHGRFVPRSERGALLAYPPVGQPQLRWFRSCPVAGGRGWRPRCREGRDTSC